MFVVELAYKRARIALSGDFLIDYLHVHFGELTFWTANVFLNELIEHFDHLLVFELAVNDVICVIFTSCFLESCLGCLFESEEF